MDYLDTSAFVKLVLAEPGSRALREALSEDVARVSSALLLVESHRAAMRYGGSSISRTHRALEGVTLVPLDDTVLQLAARLEPPLPRSLDAIHLATALSLGDDLGRFYCYDERLSAAAQALGLQAAAPG